MIKHPCQNKCSLGLGGDTCKGCGRSVEQVRDWNGYSDERKLEVLRRIEDGQEKVIEKSKCHE